jgi:hypothetical protein
MMRSLVGPRPSLPRAAAKEQLLPLTALRRVSGPPRGAPFRNAVLRAHMQARPSGPSWALLPHDMIIYEVFCQCCAVVLLNGHRGDPCFACNFASEHDEQRRTPVTIIRFRGFRCFWCCTSGPQHGWKRGREDTVRATSLSMVSPPPLLVASYMHVGRRRGRLAHRSAQGGPD